MFKFTLLTLSLYSASAMAQAPPKPVKLFYNEGYRNGGQEFPVNGECQKLTDFYYRNIGSFDIPCGGPEDTTQKTACSLYRDQECTDFIVEFDRPHYNLFTRYEDTEYVGGVLGSIKCERVDIAKPVSNTNGHESTQSQSECAGGNYQQPLGGGRDAFGDFGDFGV